ncbi:MAG: AMP-binding protein, partial [bacterium]|nr:AMP-binding protein [bacterium]
MNIKGKQGTMKNPEYSKILQTANQKIKERDYWLEKLSGEIEKSYFPPDYQESRQNEERKTGQYNYRFPGECFSKLIKVIGKSELKMHVVLAAGLAFLLQKYTGNDSIIIGTPMYRQESEADFINTVLILRCIIKERMTFKQLLSEMKQLLVEASENRNYPVEIVAEQLNKKYSPEEDFPLFDVSLLIHSLHKPEYLQGVKHNMAFTFTKTGEYIEGTVEYNEQKYKKTTIERNTSQYIRLLEAVLPDLDLELSQIDILSTEEKREILSDFNNAGAEYPRNKTINRILEEQAEKQPDNIAIVFENRTLTYRQLNEKSNRLAYRLQNRGISGNQMVGLIALRSPEMLIGMLGILKAGSAYVPLNPKAPAARNKHILLECGAQILLTTDPVSLLAEEIRFGGKLIHIDNTREEDEEKGEKTLTQTPSQSQTGAEAFA